MATDRTGLRAVASAAGPTRTCIGCRGTDSRSALLRIVAARDERGTTIARPDPWARMPGRGAWLHPDIDCFDLAVRRKAVARALRRPIDHADEVRAWLESIHGHGDRQQRQP